MKSKFEIAIRKAMLDNSYNWVMLAEEIGYNSSNNLSTAIKKNQLGDQFLIDLCKVLKLDVGEIFKLKVL